MIKLKDLLLLGSLLGVTQTFAADRALLIGIGEYQLKQHNLPGIDLDLAMMQQAAELMGFEEVKTLKNEQATLNNVINTINRYLINGVSKADRVLIYYSGHGTQIPDFNGDENQDGADEVLTMHDMRVVTHEGKKTVSNVLVDDELNGLLKRIPSHNVLVLMDACHSGTATRSMQLNNSILGDDIQIKPKFFQYEGMPLPVSRGITLKNTSSIELSDDVPFVSLASAGDFEESIATSKGSLFTLGVLSTVKKAAQTKQVLTPKILKQQVTTFIKNENQNFTPRLRGNTVLANRALILKSARENKGHNWQRLLKLSDKVAQLTLLTNQRNYKIGDVLSIDILNDQPGYLNVISVDANDNATILYPNQFHPNGLVEGNVSIPGDAMGFELVAQKPIGKSLIIGFLSSQPLNLYKAGLASRSANGQLNTVFHEISEKGFLDADKLSENSGLNWIKSAVVMTQTSD